MQEVLSQQEIDSLLAALTSGAVTPEEVGPADKVKYYDFRRPNKFSREHLRTLEMLHQQFARRLSSFLSGYLGTAITIEMALVGQMIFEEFIRSIPSPTVLVLFGLKPLEGLALLEINTQAVFPMLDLLFGGPGAAIEHSRELTDIEIKVVSRLSERILEYLAVSWEDFYSFTPEIQVIETNPRMQQIYSPNEIVALITLSVTINEENRGFMNLCLPYLVLEPVISRLSMQEQFIRHAGTPKPGATQWLQHWLGLSPVELMVTLGETEITIRELLQLQVGDVLVLNRRIDQDLDLYVEKKRKFGVQPGVVGDNIAVQVVSLAEGEKNNV